MNDHLLKRVTGNKGGKGGGGGATRVAQEAPNTLQSKSVLRVVEVFSEGEIVGLLNGAKSIYLDNTPLQNDDDSFNFNGVNFDTREGTPDQDPVPGFSNIETEVAVGVQVEQATPVVRTINDAETDSVRVAIRIPALTEQDTSNGDLNGSTVEFKIEYQPNGGSYITAVSGADGTITGKTVSPYERQYYFQLTGSAPWNIRVTRITDDNEAANIQNDIFWSSYTRIIEHKLIYPDTALIGLEVDSSLFGSAIPTRSYEIKGLIINVPSNYDPETREYDGVWDGTFQLAWTDNPAWVLYDLIVNERYGLGQFIDAAEVDKFAFYTIAQYCDELIDDGDGGTEPRFTFNGIIESQEDALKVLQTVASVFRGMLYWGAEGTSGVITPVHDAPKDAVKIFTQANVIEGLFTYSGASLSARHSAVYVTWNDPNRNYESSIEVVEDPVLIDAFGYKRLDVVAYGCTSRGQAHRFGKWILDSEANESEIVNFSVGLADADIRPGDIIKIQDRDYANADFGGRLVSGTVDALTLDREITLVSDVTYEIDVVLPDGTIETKTIADGPGDYTEVNLNSSLSQAPDVNTMWAVTSSALAPRQFRVISMRETNAAEFEITANLYDSTKFARVEQDLNLPTIPFTNLTTGVIEPPSNFGFFEYLFQNGPLVQSAVTVSWEASPDSRVVNYSLEIKKPGAGNNFELYQAAISGLSIDVKPTFDGDWEFRVRGYDALGNPSPYLTSGVRTLVINGQPPADVSNFAISTIGDTTILSWDPVTNLNLHHYTIAYNPLTSGASWNNSVIIVEQVPADTTQIQVPSRSGTYLIKAVTNPTANYPQGVASVNATLIVTTIDFLLNFNFIYEMIEDPDFDGTKTNCEVSMAGNLELSEETSGVFYAEGTYEFDENYFDLGAVYTNRLTPYIVVSGNNVSNLVDDWVNVDEILNVDGSGDDQWGVELQIRTTNDDPSGSPTWSDWTPITSGDYQFRAIEARLKLYSYAPTVTPSVENLKLVIDMPDIIQGASDILTDAGGSAILFPYAFRNDDPELAIAAQDMQQGDYWQISSKSKNGFTIRFFDSSDTGIARTFDYHAKGYGVETT